LALPIMASYIGRRLGMAGGHSPGLATPRLIGCLIGIIVLLGVIVTLFARSAADAP
jgi:ethanolamine transporter EutH